jgi:uncharacterized membrane protein
MADSSSTPEMDQIGAEEATVEDLLSDLAAFTGEEHDSAIREEIRHLKELLAHAHERGLIDSDQRALDTRDAAEAFVGSVIFASPLLVEDGIFDIGQYLFEYTVAGVPVFLIANTVFVVFMTYALMEWTGQNREDTHLLFGALPLRLLVVLGVSFVVAAILMTVWGRTGGWDQPTEALARINVLWTVGSLGAALGDIVSENDTPEQTAALAASTDRYPGEADSASPAVRELSDTALVNEITTKFDDLKTTVETAEERAELQRIRNQTIQAAMEDTFGEDIQKYTSRDIAEAFVGSVFFSIPFLVEDGVFDVADYFLSFRIGLFPVFFLINAAFVILMILALVYWAGPQDVQINNPIFGFVPRRLVGIAVVSFLTAAMLMTMWGRVDNWADPVVALARISVVWTVASFGAALGDILPGESSGEDITDELNERRE